MLKSVCRIPSCKSREIRERSASMARARRCLSKKTFSSAALMCMEIRSNHSRSSGWNGGQLAERFSKNNRPAACPSWSNATDMKLLIANSCCVGPGILGKIFKTCLFLRSHPNPVPFRPTYSNKATLPCHPAEIRLPASSASFRAPAVHFLQTSSSTKKCARDPYPGRRGTLPRSEIHRKAPQAADEATRQAQGPHACSWRSVTRNPAAPQTSGFGLPETPFPLFRETKRQKKKPSTSVLSYLGAAHSGACPTQIPTATNQNTKRPNIADSNGSPRQTPQKTSETK